MYAGQKIKISYNQWVTNDVKIQKVFVKQHTI